MRKPPAALARSAYEPVMLGVFGFGPGFTLLIGLPPLTPSAIARTMSTSTMSLLPNNPHAYTVAGALLGSSSLRSLSSALTS